MDAHAPHQWSGDDWQNWCDLLFQERHAPAGYARVPDTDRGDLGLEGYSTDGTGCMYQCYATDAVDVGRRYEAQRDKMTADLRKLVTHQNRVAKLLGSHRMAVWIFMVPLHDSKELVMHARRKEDELRAATIAFLTEDFTVQVQTDEKHFAKERAALDAAGIASIPSLSEIAEADADEAIAVLKLEEADQVLTMDGKLARAGTRDVTAVRDRMLRRLVDADNIAEQLRQNYPHTHERVLTEQRIEERAILEERDFNQLHAGSITEVRRRLQDRLVVAASGIGADHASRLAHGAVGRWLLECPLDFVERP